MTSSGWTAPTVAATPPGWFPGAGLLIVPGLAAFYALATTCGRPYLTGYLVGLVHVAGFSWSLHHVLLLGYVCCFQQWSVLRNDLLHCMSPMR